MVVAAVIMIVTRSGIPSVTLLGERSDWDNLLAKLDEMHTFGEEPRLLFIVTLAAVTTIFPGGSRPSASEIEKGRDSTIARGWNFLKLSFRRSMQRIFLLPFNSVPVKVTDYAAGRFYELLWFPVWLASKQRQPLRLLTQRGWMSTRSGRTLDGGCSRY
ncbi:uncharacterized protein N7458_009754 [Penicillium daleae]|uniref:Uncharacterized protein n=1 Tax=Penicillium daleae TaxID=63821 RepID=A0AAD6BZV1_9EURO|nr:uncharacterized protein N7458_009754 [Penicillium daleae]KAJ5438756.1 hypothetical protein N7458_009754 [Penicillium daleae]